MINSKDRLLAIKFLDSSYQVFHHPGPTDKIRIYKIKADIYFERRNYNMASMYSDSIIFISQGRLNEEKFAADYADALFIKGDLYGAVKNYNESIHYYVLGKQIANTRVKEKCTLVGYNGRIAYLIYQQGKYLLAASYFKQAYDDESNCS